MGCGAFSFLFFEGAEYLSSQRSEPEPKMHSVCQYIGVKKKEYFFCFSSSSAYQSTISSTSNIWAFNVVTDLIQDWDTAIALHDRMTFWEHRRVFKFAIFMLL